LAHPWFNNVQELNQL